MIDTTEEDNHVSIGGYWKTDKQLEEWEKVEDESC